MKQATPNYWFICIVVAFGMLDARLIFNFAIGGGEANKTQKELHKRNNCEMIRMNVSMILEGGSNKMKVQANNAISLRLDSLVSGRNEKSFIQFYCNRMSKLQLHYLLLQFSIICNVF